MPMAMPMSLIHRVSRPLRYIGLSRAVIDDRLPGLYPVRQCSGMPRLAVVYNPEEKSFY